MKSVTLDGVSMWYGSLQVLSDVTFDVAPGEMLGLLGTNGAGKSTVLRVLTGLAHPQEGRVLFDGEDVTDLTTDRRVAQGLAMVAGGRAVFPELTVKENFDLGAFLLGPERDERIERELDRFPVLKERLSQAAGSMSGGQQQQLAIAKALLTDPSVLCIDELSLGLSPMMLGELLEAVRTVNADGVTCIIVEQSLNVAAALCHRAIFLEKGAVQFEGPPGDLLDRGDLARAIFLGANER